MFEISWIFFEYMERQKWMLKCIVMGKIIIKQQAMFKLQKIRIKIHNCCSTWSLIQKFGSLIQKFGSLIQKFGFSCSILELSKITVQGHFTLFQSSEQEVWATEFDKY